LNSFHFATRLIFSLLLLHSAQVWANFDLAAENKTFNYINQLRGELNLTPFHANAQLHQSARRHSQYDTINNIQGHYESSNHRFFTGKTPSDRAFLQGYHSVVSEVVSYNARYPKKYVDDLMSAIYHRLGLIVGYAKRIG
jgi:uncharacterized protein YkwD